MTKHTLNASSRTLTGRKVKQLRHAGLIPANVFGKNVESKAIEIDAKKFETLHKQAGESTLIYLKIEGEKEERPVLIREIGLNPVTDEILHITFNQVSLKEKVTAPVPLTFVGESPADRDQLGILVKMIDEIEIEALPTNIPEAIEIDLSSLTEVGSSLSVFDIKVTPDVEITTAPETLIVKIEPLAEEEPTEAPAAEGEAATPAAEGETTEAAAETSEKTDES